MDRSLRGWPSKLRSERLGRMPAQVVRGRSTNVSIPLIDPRREPIVLSMINCRQIVASRRRLIPGGNMNRGTIRRLALASTATVAIAGVSSSGVSASVPPDTTEVSAAEPNEAVAGFELAPYIREHVDSGETLQVSSTSPMIFPVPTPKPSASESSRRWKSWASTLSFRVRPPALPRIRSRSSRH